MSVPTFPIEGGCVCGAVRYRVTGAPLGVYTCHCKDCQRSSGATGTLSMIIARERVELTRGELSGYDKTADSGRVVRMMGCATCGTRVWNEPQASLALLVVKPGTLDDIDWLSPVGNIWTDSKAPWIEINADEPNFPRQPADRQPLFDAWAKAVAGA